MIKDSETLLQFFKIRVTSQGHGPFAIGMIFDHSNFIFVLYMGFSRLGIVKKLHVQRKTVAKVHFIKP